MKWSYAQEIPEHLRQFIVEQDPSLYTAIDQAGWRYIMRISKAFFAKTAHQKYLDGLKETGISSEHIPLISEMDQCLGAFGWRAVAVSGFIPPAVFMEFQSLGILPIACDMRKLENLAYTPAPDIVHEAAGHAPIIADPEYSDYLRSYGDVSRRAIFSSQDLLVYEAIRALSDIKEDPSSSEARISEAQQRLDAAVAAVDYVSEASYLARMSWWTTEYGLVGSMENPKIYGAGLLSSVGESYNCLSPQIKKIPFSIDCIETAYDITKPQPQLFVTPDFPTLIRVLDEFSKSMAFRQGGKTGLEKAVRAKATTSTLLDSGIQIGGTLSEFLCDSNGQPSYLIFKGPTQLAHEDRQVDGHGATYHKEGFGSPVGPLATSGRSPSDLTDEELEKLGFIGDQPGTLTFASGVVVRGTLKSFIRRNKKNLILSFAQCTVTRGEKVLFAPEWGTYDMACGTQVASVFGGAPDRVRYMMETGGYAQKPSFPKSNRTESNQALIPLYTEVRKIRENGRPEADTLSRLSRIHETLESEFGADWLLRMELLELNHQFALSAPWEKTVLERLKAISQADEIKASLIKRGLEHLR